MHLPKLIEDLALILIVGTVTTLIFKRIKQPLVLGYIIAGFVVGPHFSLTPTVVDNASVKVWAEIGVIFLLFSLGLEFSFKKLVRVGGAASVTAFTEIIFITIAGYLLGKWMGWSTMDSLFLGGMLASSSTTIIIKAFDELGIKGKHYARIVFGVLIVEDIVVILLMVLLSTMAVSKHFEGMEMIYTVVKLLFFLALWFIAGIFLLPSLFKKAKKFLDDETLLILSIGLCLGMVVIATQVGFSAELGAFIMGSIIAETTKAEKVEHLIKPVKDLFGTVFFVSVGMMIDPKVIAEYSGPVLWVTLLTLFGKLFSTTFGALISGQPLKQSVQVGMSMAQIGEFAFIVATLGLSLGVISDFLFPVAVGASAITTFTTPYLIRFSDPIYHFLEKKLPPRFVASINRYSSHTQSINAQSAWNKVLISYLKIVISNGIIVLGMLLFSIKFLDPFISRTIDNAFAADITSIVITLLIVAPFLWAMMAKRPTISAYKELWIDQKYNKGPLLIIEILRNLLGVLIIGFILDYHFTTGIALLAGIPIVVLVMIMFSKRIQRFYRRLERNFLTNLNARQNLGAQNSILHFDADADGSLLPWDAHIIDMQVAPDAEYAGKTLIELAWREQFGVNIIYVKRGERIIHAPGRTVKLLPFDLVGIIATDEQLQIFKPTFDATDKTEYKTTELSNIALQTITVNEYNRLKGKSIRESAIREITNGLVIGIERKGRRLLNPESETIFEWGDIVWIVGDRRKILRLGKSSPQQHS